MKWIAYVENLLDATLLLFQNTTPGLEVFNYADMPCLTTEELVNLIPKKAGGWVPTAHILLRLALGLEKGVDLMGLLFSSRFPIDICKNTELLYANLSYRG